MPDQYYAAIVHRAYEGISFYGLYTTPEQATARLDALDIDPHSQSTRLAWTIDVNTPYFDMEGKLYVDTSGRGVIDFRRHEE